MIDGLDAGADDYITKPFEPLELKVRLRTGKRILFLQDQLISSRDALRDQATHDQLTGLWNRAAITGILEDELVRSLREGSSVGVVMGDLDYFKLINDTHGHCVGDDVLRQTALAMRGAIRRYDSLGRYGGEEFLFVLPGCDRATATSHAERLRATLNEVVIQVPQGQVKPSISMGVAVADAQNHSVAADLIHAADVALYRAKHAGRDRVEFADVAELSAVDA
jgi:diguanylate cyclase (GGDEF)-like protein